MNQSEDMSKQNSFKSSKEIQNVTEKLECCSTTPTNSRSIASNNNNNDDHRKSNDFTNHQTLRIRDQHYFSKGTGVTTPNDSCDNFRASTFWEEGIPPEDTNEQNLPIENRENAATAINGSGSINDHREFHHCANQQIMCPYQNPHFGYDFGFTTPNDSFRSVKNSFNATGAATNWQQGNNIHQENPPFIMGPPISPRIPDFSHRAEPFHRDNSHRRPKRPRTKANNVVVGPQTAAALPRDVSFSNPVPLLEGNGWQARSQQSPRSSDTSEAVCFGWIKHPPNKVWRSKVKLFSDDRANYPTWSDGICDQVKRLLEQEGYNTFFVCEREGNKIRGKWQVATDQEVLERTKQRFVDDRRYNNQKSLPPNEHSVISPRKDSQSTVSTSPNSSPTNSMMNVEQEAAAVTTAAVSPPKGTDLPAGRAKAPPLEDVQGDDVTRNILVIDRNPWYPITTREVCFEWDLHPGTKRWREVVERFAANEQDFPTWTDSIAECVKEELDSEDIHYFLVFLDFKGEPCLDTRNGLWYRATAVEVLEKTKEQFRSDRMAKNLSDDVNEQNLSVDLWEGAKELERCLHESPLLDLSEAASPVDATTATKSSSMTSNDDDDDAMAETRWLDDLPSVDDIGYLMLNDISRGWSLTSYDDVAEKIRIRGCSRQKNSSLAMGQQFSPRFTDSLLETNPSLQGMVHRGKTRLRVNETGFVVTPQMAAAPQKNVSVFDTATDPEDDGGQAEKAVCFGWINHQPTIVWCNVVKQFSDNRANYEAWSDDICNQVKGLLEQEGYNTFLVCERDGNMIFDGVRFRGTLRQATDQEVLEKTKQRFLDERKLGRLSKNKRRGKPPMTSLEHFQQSAATAAASSDAVLLPELVDLTTTCVKTSPLEDMPGTMRWRQVVESFSANKQDFPTWTDSIAGRVEEQLDSEDIHCFLVFLNSKDKPCVDTRNGLCYRATADEILKRTKEQFCSDRQRLEEESSSDDDKKRPAKPSGGRPNDGSSSSGCSHGLDDSSFSFSDDEESSKPNSNITTAVPDIMESLSASVRQIKIDCYEEGAAKPIIASDADTSALPAVAPCPLDETEGGEEIVLPPEEQSKETDSKIIRAGLKLGALSSATEDKVNTEPTENDVSLVDNGRLFKRQLSDHEGSSNRFGNTITVLFSSPLVHEQDMRYQTFDQLNLNMERELLWKSLREAKMDLKVVSDTATRNRLLSAMNTKCTCLHYSGHGHQNFLAFEDGKGGTDWIGVQQMQSLLACAHPFQLVFVSSCHSFKAGQTFVHSFKTGQTFVQAGIRHVVCCQQNSKRNDLAALVFTQQFYLALCKGHTVKQSFEFGQKAVLATPTLREGEMRKFLLLPQDGDHDVPIFQADQVTTWPADEKARISYMMQKDPSPTPPQYFVGRELDMYLVLNGLLDKRLVSVIGEPGVGRSSLVSALCNYINERRSSLDTKIERMYLVHPKQRRPGVTCHELILQLSEKLVEAGKAQADFQSDFESIQSHICKSLKNEKALIVFDRTELLETPKEAERFCSFLSKLVRKTRKVKVLLTGCRSLGIPYIDGGQVEQRYQLGPLAFHNSVRLFANLCPHVRDQVGRKELYDRLVTESHQARLCVGDPLLNDRTRRIFKALGNGFPARIERAAHGISVGELERLGRSQTTWY